MYLSAKYPCTYLGFFPNVHYYPKRVWFSNGILQNGSGGKNTVKGPERLSERYKTRLGRCVWPGSQGDLSSKRIMSHEAAC